MNIQNNKSELRIKASASYSFSAAVFIFWGINNLISNYVIFIPGFYTSRNSLNISMYVLMGVSGIVALVLGVLLLITKRPSIASSILAFILSLYPIIDQIVSVQGDFLSYLRISIKYSTYGLPYMISMFLLSVVLIWSGIYILISHCSRNKRANFLNLWFIPLVLYFLSYITYLIMWFVKNFERNYDGDFLEYITSAMNSEIRYVLKELFIFVIFAVAVAFIAKASNLYNKGVACEESTGFVNTASESKEVFDTAYIPQQPTTPPQYQYIPEQNQPQVQSFYTPYQTAIQSQSYYAPTQNEQIANDIERFKKLLDDGAITPEEYEIKKRQLLGL